MKTLLLVAATLALASPLTACSSKTPTPTPDKQLPLQPPSPLTIRVVNHRDAPIFVTSQTRCAQMPYAITGSDDRPLHLDGQSFDCDTVRQGNCPTVGGCQGAGVFRLEPGQEVTRTWDGTSMNERTLPSREVAEGCPSSCVEWKPVPAGDYTFHAAAWSACTGECACSGTPDAPCDLSSVLRHPADLAAKATVKLPGAAEVVVSFEK